ncbi:hypothetical protein VDGE_07658 [Verticillium dahliae]|uniref:AAA+ ATPase domain-containing protein n=1 Tax=Verticillium dahliae TaxID=27337 RepID=A0A444S4M5_VERDA|nr:hypothetical protein VDGE_07658 [Verticillium dahliae]
MAVTKRLASEMAKSTSDASSSANAAGTDNSDATPVNGDAAAKNTCCCGKKKKAAKKIVEEDEKEEESDEDEDEDEDGDNSDTESVDSNPDAEIGSISTVKNIYRSKKDDDGNWTWQSAYPDDVISPAENKSTAKYAVLVRNIKSTAAHKKLEAHSIAIQSPWLKKALGHILEDYPGVACELAKLEFEAPFQPFVHRWTEFVEYRKREDLDDLTKEHLTVLHDILVYEIGQDIAAFEDYMKTKVITFEHLWMIFAPSDIIVAAHQGPLSAFEMYETEYKETRCGNVLAITAECVDYDGKTFGRHKERMSIPEFLGAKPITGLNAYPLKFHEQKEALVTSLTHRGLIFEQLAGHHYKQYEGDAITWDREGNEVPVDVSGRIVVDIKSFNSYSPYPSRYLRDWRAKDIEALQAYKREHGLAENGNLRLTPYLLLIARSRTRGYSLKRKKWLDFFVSQVREVVWNTDAFDKLVLDEDQKELILAFSEAQLSGSSFDDVISGKGKGIICLLSGPPGVGKTLTAEAVAENLRVPLHTLSSGDLGSQPWEVENGLSQILELVARWDAILLLDECDVFLEARSTHDLERNKVVSIFLRTLEYYEGILFMTTNRVDNIDAAFQSRIHVSLEYPDLTTESRRVIWRNFLNGSKIDVEVSDAELDELAELPLNGRQIKNILKTAQLLAVRKKSALQKGFIDTVLSIEKQRPGVKTE